MGSAAGAAVGIGGELPFVCCDPTVGIIPIVIWTMVVVVVLVVGGGVLVVVMVMMMMAMVMGLAMAVVMWMVLTILGRRVNV